ncbi:G3E family GTPase [Neisseria sp. HSC-16F19]|nr:GTP-binding protein [Neisseria sp. HSC-16F19]MCP2041488.1 G3E family GTPase [Neisseria sp. HSC-16F19]
MDNIQAAIPVTLLTGFLGSGKTTLLNRLLADPRGVRAAVLINEFGEVGLDHLLAKNVEGTKVVIKNGCICCTVHESLRDTLKGLLNARDKGEIPAFDRLLIETSGASDPLPVMMTLRSDPMFQHHFRMENIITTVDALNGLQQLADRATAVRQAAMADYLVITKTALQNHAAALQNLREQLAAIAPEAQIISDADNRHPWDVLMSPRKTLATAAGQGGKSVFRAVSLHQAGTGINSFALAFEQTPDWSRFAVWLSLLMHRHGNHILRIKGLLKVAGSDQPMLLNAVQNFIHPPEHLPEWPDDDRRSRLVFITDGIDPEQIKRALEKVLQLEKPA